MKSLTLAAGLALLALINPPLTAADVRDHFTLTEQRPAGTLLDGTDTEAGQAVWQSQRGVFIEDEQGNGVVRVRGGGVGYAYVATPAMTSVSQLVLRAQVRFGDPTPGTDEIGIAFVSQFNNMIVLDNGINLALRRNGKWDVRFRGQAGLARGVATDFDPSGWNSLELILDAGNNRITAKINGTTVLDNARVPTMNPINFAGFQFGSAPVGSALDNFVLSITEQEGP